MAVDKGDGIEIRAWRDENEYVRIDKIVLKPDLDAPADCLEVVVACEDFEDGAQGWSIARTAHDNDLTSFLGRFDGHENPKKAFDVPHDAQTVAISFDLV